MVELPAGASDPGAILLQGDFLDGVVESTLRSIVDKLKVEYRKELSKALQAASPDATATPKSCRAGGIAGFAEAEQPSCTLVRPLADAQPAQPTPQGTGGGADAAQSQWQVETVEFKGKDGQVYRSSPNTLGEGVVSTGCADGEESFRSLRLAMEATERAPSEEQPAELAASEPTLNVPAAEHGDGGDGAERIRLANGAANTARLHPSKSAESIKPPAAQLPLTAEDQEFLEEIRDAENARAAKAEVFAQMGRLRNSTYHLMSPDTDEALSWSKKMVFQLIASPKFDFGMGGIIIFNAVTIGLETSITRQKQDIPAYLHVLEYSFLFAYCVELSLRIYAVGWKRAFISNWVKFDATMVVAGILNFIITVSALGGDAASSVVDNVNMLKMIRLFRLARTVRVLVQFRTLWMLVQGLMYAVLPMLWTAMLMIVVVYVFAVIAMETILDDSTKGSDYSEACRNFDTIGDAMITLMQFIAVADPRQCGGNLQAVDIVELLVDLLLLDFCSAWSHCPDEHRDGDHGRVLPSDRQRGSGGKKGVGPCGKRT
ncbi:unnamed protein product [Prorocentrum cordatum]|uniref:Ion transport domain-containing protein n=1 Tax=Prorocentrum cordatum TaxID=2364126 RepID=A0ABN9XC32_9DINO|nr:unnamed protein product [Polarella glacialis]